MHMASREVAGDTGTIWSSLFLPLKEEVIFASFITLLSPVQEQDQPLQVVSSREMVSDDIQPEGGNNINTDENIENNANDARSPLFALCGERADSAVCVLADGGVVFFDLTNEYEGPKEIRRFSAGQLNGCKYHRATCAALIPLDVSYACRVPAAAAPSSVGRTMYLRGVVGSSDGRVDVFSEHGFLFGFVAHDTPVVSVATIYSRRDEEEEGSRNISSGPENNGSNGPLPPHGQDTRRRFEVATVDLGFVTSNSEGVVYVWKRQGLSLKPQIVDRSTLFSRTLKWHVVQPSSREWLLNGINAIRAPLLVYTTPGMESSLRVCSSVTLEDVESRVKLPGSSFCARTTAIVSDEKLALVARGRNVYSVFFADGQCNPVFTARHTVTGLYLNNSGLAAATCDSQGLLYVLTVRPMAVLGYYTVRGGGSIRSVSLHSASRLVTIVNKDGAVEIALMPEKWANKSLDNLQPGDNDVMDSLQAAKALYCLVSLQKQQDESASTSGNATQQSAAYESLLLARMAIPEETNRYLRRAAGVA